MPTKNPELPYYMRRKIQTYQRKRDVSIFGSYVHPPCRKMDHNKSYWFAQVQINYHCFRVSNFAPTHFLKDKSVAIFISQHPEHSILKRHFQIYKSTVRRLTQDGFDPVGNPLFLPHFGRQIVHLFPNETYHEVGEDIEIEYPSSL